MLFRKKMERRCFYCLHCTKLDEMSVLCIKRGVMPVDGNCMKFRYDPCKRVPSKPKTLNFAKYEKEDYSL